MAFQTVEPGLAKLACNTIRMLSVDAVDKANSGHPGLPMGAADVAFVLFSRYLSFDSKDPDWAGRDRFLLSAGHGSMLLYSLLHLYGYDLPLDELKKFRQLNSMTPGHPEVGDTPGIETTTGPLGQGFANAVGMALAAKMMQARFERDGFCPCGTRIFALVSDGDLMEGISYEAASLAGHLGLGNIVFLYDSNDITIEGNTGLTWTEDPVGRFTAAGWDVHYVDDGHDHEKIASAIDKGIACTDKPSIIVCRTHIGYGSPKVQDSAAAHGAPLGAEETLATKKNLGWPESPAFLIPDEVADMFAAQAEAKRKDREKWEEKFNTWERNYPQLAADWNVVSTCALPVGLLEKMLEVLPEGPTATRALSGTVLQVASKYMPSLFGGSADLSPSNKTDIKGQPAIAKGDFSGKNMHFGIREHAMGAVANGMSLFGCLRPYTGTFLVFADYMRPAIRLAALTKRPVIFVFTHDSFWVGEDGPTHQPIEHVASLRIIPNLWVVRPGDGVETAAAWQMALARQDGPTAIVLTRQKLNPIPHADKLKSAKAALSGAYVVAPAKSTGCKNVVIASGSEVATCVEAQALLAGKGIDFSVVSMLCHEAFMTGDQDSLNAVIPPDAENVFWVEAGNEPLAYKFVKGRGLIIGMNRFGTSAPGKVLADLLGFTPEKIAARIEEAL